MEPTPTIRIEVALPAATVLDQLARYGKDWHESRKPPEFRGTFWLTVQGSSFELTLPRVSRSVVWRGSVVDAEGGGGSVIKAAAERVRIPLIAWLLMGAVAGGYEVWRGLPLTVALVFALIGLALMPIVGPRYRAGVAKREAPFCRAILLRATQWTPQS
ncbi:MAG TPA: hypothetical protein VH539_24435 [Gemmatimonadaceae bacterium]|jgi:hypothetical protein